jgi:ATP-dependent DNA helicase DinG
MLDLAAYDRQHEKFRKIWFNMSLSDSVEQAFAKGSALAGSTSNYSSRAPQLDMAKAVADVVEWGGVLVVEAGTGVGKTYAYLLPALLSGRRVLVSTATKNLQDQLFGRDLPRLTEALGLPTRTALLKGRGSYLCLHRLPLARQSDAGADRALAHTLAKIETWAQVTRTGDFAELPGLDERSAAIPLVSSTRDNCLGSECPQWRNCHVNQARREALAADVVVVNHHLFFADMMVRESGVAELLPSVDVVIFDEAHQLNETGVQFLGVQLSTAQLLDFSRDLLAAGLQFARGLADWSVLAGGCERAARELRLLVGRQAAGARLRWTAAAPEGIADAAWLQGLDVVHESLDAATQALALVAETAPDFVRLIERVELYQTSLAQLRQPLGVEAVRWLEVGAQLRLTQAPLDIAATMRQRLLKLDNPESSSNKAWVFTSATLGDDEGLSWFTQSCGLDAVPAERRDAAPPNDEPAHGELAGGAVPVMAKILRLGSPFNYAEQAAIYVPTQFPKPSDPGHSEAVARLVAHAARCLGGRTLVLTTTLRALQQIAQTLEQRFEGDRGFEVLVQGRASKRSLLERFEQGSSQGAAACVLVASASFWEGVDIPGSALQLVVIDKLPFPPPGDPLVEARSKRLESQGLNPFSDYFLPEAAVALKQGAGRLIRREDDQGVLVVCDPRLRTMPYGRRLLKALPPMLQMDNAAQLEQRLLRMATALQA